MLRLERIGKKDGEMIGVLGRIAGFVRVDSRKVQLFEMHCYVPTVDII
jgi:hypothetical protein